MIGIATVARAKSGARQCLLQMFLASRQDSGQAFPVIACFQVSLVAAGVGAVRRRAAGPARSFTCKASQSPQQYRLVLQICRQVPVISLRPEMASIRRRDQLWGRTVSGCRCLGHAPSRIFVTISVPRFRRSLIFIFKFKMPSGVQSAQAWDMGKRIDDLFARPSLSIPAPSQPLM